MNFRKVYTQISTLTTTKYIFLCANEIKICKLLYYNSNQYTIYIDTFASRGEKITSR